jgi:monoamine oxidase
MDEFKDMLFLFSPRSSFPTIWTAARNEPVLTVWAGGPRAARMLSQPDDVMDRAVDAVAGAFDLPAADIREELTGSWFHDWSRDPNIGGAYTYVAVGGIESTRILAESVDDTLFFAGEATAENGYNATMEGAVRSGMRAADEIMQLANR